MQKLCNYNGYDGWGSAEFLGVNEDRIFISSQRGHLGPSWSTQYYDLKSSQFVSILDGYCSLDVQGDWFYISQSKRSTITGGYVGADQFIKKSISNGVEKILLPGVAARSIATKGDWIYYSTDKGLFKVKTDGTENLKLSDDGVNTAISIVGNWMFYVDTNEGKVGKIALDI